MLVIHHGDVEKLPKMAMRWLGIWLDSTLTFRTHVEKWMTKAQAVAYHLRGLTNTKRGPLPSAVRNAIRACVEPVFLYGAEACTQAQLSPDGINLIKTDRQRLITSHRE